MALGLCRQTELDAAVQKAAKKARPRDVMSDDERRKLVSTENSLGMPDEPRLPTAIAGLENFSLSRDDKREPEVSAESLFKKREGDKARRSDRSQR